MEEEFGLQPTPRSLFTTSSFPDDPWNSTLLGYNATLPSEEKLDMFQFYSVSFLCIRQMDR